MTIFNNTAIELLADCIALHGESYGAATFVELVTTEAIQFASNNDDKLKALFEEREEARQNLHIECLNLNGER